MRRTVLFSFAHPDDESFAGVGLACWCRARDARVVLLCATRGERGKAGDPEISGAPQDLATARERELREAARIAGIEHVHLLGYRDRELGGAEPHGIRRLLVEHVRRYRPEVVLTFDPNGFNVHPDHVAISRFTSDAIAAAADVRWLPDAGAARGGTAPVDASARAARGGAIGSARRRARRGLPDRHLAMERHESRRASRASHAAPLGRGALPRSARCGPHPRRRNLSPGVGAAPSSAALRRHLRGHPVKIQ